MVAAAEHRRVEQAVDVGRLRPGHRRCGRRRSRPRPSARANRARASRCARSRRRARAFGARLRQRGRDLVGADRDARRRRAERRCAAAHRSRLREQRIELASSSSRPTTLPSSMADGRDGAQAKAIDRLERDARHPPWCSPHAQRRAAACARAASASPPAAWQASARQSFSTCRPGRLAAEVMIEGDDAVHLGAREVQRLRDQRHGRFAARSRTPPAARAGSAAADRPMPACSAAISRGSLRAPWFVSRHASCTALDSAHR